MHLKAYHGIAATQSSVVTVNQELKEKYSGNKTSPGSNQPLYKRSAPAPSECAGDSAVRNCNHALPLELEEPVRLEMTEQLNQLLADTITLRDLYKKSHWQLRPTRKLLLLRDFMTTCGPNV
jgi:starvation-inducible DNA-binding protein